MEDVVIKWKKYQWVEVIYQQKNQWAEAT